MTGIGSLALLSAGIQKFEEAKRLFWEVIKMERVLSAKRFWDVYSAKLNERGNWEDYKDNTRWTTAVIDVAMETCKKLGIEASKEDYRVDLIGYRREKPEEKGNWWLDVAYEHENDDTWWGELCKLCYVAADLRVISSYYKLAGADKSAEETIEDKLRGYLGRLGKEKIFRVPNSQWLFVFGPRLVCANKPFRAFTMDDDLSIRPVGGGERVVPEDWQKRDS